ncbi:hypothetical protein GCM10007874_31750 [Labrys miyagiensis]|uniref:Uncharacterized protein n=1 Tax=Labrys miyagiensis TaxID=346912 RepID=A0ABQ6CIS5_9HYPH|nr:hypothetical protein GCM10007874_31750 [Labrys miyagiensis]
MVSKAEATAMNSRTVKSVLSYFCTGLIGALIGQLLFAMVFHQVRVDWVLSLLVGLGAAAERLWQMRR